MKRWFAFIWEVLHEIGQSRARSHLRRGGWDY